MTEKEKPNYLEDIVTFQYANAAARLASDEKTAMFAKGALEKMLEQIEQLDPKYKKMAKAGYEGAFASEDGTKIAIGINAREYQTALEGLGVMDFYNLRLDILKGILGEDKANEAKTVFEKYGEQSVGSILKKISQSNEIKQNTNGLYDDKQKEEAQKTIDKLKYMNNMIQWLEQINYEKLVPSATKGTYKELFTEALEKA